MENKSSGAPARVPPETEKRAGKIAERADLPAAPVLNTRDAMSGDEFDSMMDIGYRQALNGEGDDAEAFFSKLRKPNKKN